MNLLNGFQVIMALKIMVTWVKIHSGYILMETDGSVDK
jgi:hypothetical protein